ncbi:MAG: hypothetical protein P8Y99_10520 [Calditrichaceae bacterium]|jgi:hypothetical protein
MKLETKLILYLCCFALVDIIIPVPITAIILIYAVLSKPPWFKEMVTEIYSVND